MRAVLRDGSTVTGDVILYATGREPNTKDLGLDAAGVECDAHGAVIVDGFSRSNVPTIFAVGDVTNRANLTPVAIAEGHALAETLFAGRPTRVDYAGIPTAVFSQPPLATVGLTEAEARAGGRPIAIYRSSFRALKHTLSGRDEKTLIKLVVDAESDRVLGLSHGRRRGAGDRAGARHRAAMRGHQGALRCHDRHPPHRGGGVRVAAHPRGGRVARSEGTP